MPLDLPVAGRKADRGGPRLAGDGRQSVPRLRESPGHERACRERVRCRLPAQAGSQGGRVVPLPVGRGRGPAGADAAGVPPLHRARAAPALPALPALQLLVRHRLGRPEVQRETVAGRDRAVRPRTGRAARRDARFVRLRRRLGRRPHALGFSPGLSPRLHAAGGGRRQVSLGRGHVAVALGRLRRGRTSAGSSTAAPRASRPTPTDSPWPGRSTTPGSARSASR